MTKNIKFNITDASSGAAFTVKVVTRAEETELAGIEADGSLKIRLQAASNDDGANEELISFLAHILNVDQNQIEIVAGGSKRTKLISVEGISPEQLENLLDA
jgi:uncharacterized protein YggU (UPF0235/DUF167 family)